MSLRNTARKQNMHTCGVNKIHSRDREYACTYVRMRTTNVHVDMSRYEERGENALPIPLLAGKN